MHSYVYKFTAMLTQESAATYAYTCDNDMTILLNVANKRVYSKFSVVSEKSNLQTEDGRQVF